MYLTRITLDPRSWQARRDVGSAYQMHSTLVKLYEKHKDEERILFRLDWDRHDQSTRVLVLSRTIPDFASLYQSYALKIEGPMEYDPKLQQGQQLTFRLLANPTRKTKTQDEERRPVRIPLLTEDEQEKWLLRKMQEAGAEVLDCRFNALGKQTNKKHDESGDKQTHFAVLFEGSLKVVQPDGLKQAIFNGFGSAKGYGFGLLSVGPLR